MAAQGGKYIIIMKKYIFTIMMAFFVMSCNQNTPEESGKALKNTQISYQTEIDGYSSAEYPYNGELTESQIMSIYNMALSTYGDRGLYHYVTFSDAKTEAQVKALAIEFGKKADDMVRTQYNIPGALWPGYTKVLFKVNYVYDGKIITVATYDYMH